MLIEGMSFSWRGVVLGFGAERRVIAPQIRTCCACTLSVFVGNTTNTLDSLAARFTLLHRRRFGVGRICLLQVGFKFRVLGCRVEGFRLFGV